jgi:hypothetical protein
MLGARKRVSLRRGILRGALFCEFREPFAARVHNESGVAQVEFAINRIGRVLSSQIRSATTLPTEVSYLTGLHW